MSLNFVFSNSNGSRHSRELRSIVKKVPKIVNGAGRSFLKIYLSSFSPTKTFCMKNLTTLLVFSLALLACESGPRGNQYRDALIKGHDELFTKANYDYADQLMSSSYAGVGPEFVKQYVRSLKTAFPDLEIKVDPIITEGNRAGWVRTHTGTHQGDFMGHKATGKKFTWQEIVLSEFDEDGKVKDEKWASNFDEMLQNSSNVEGVYEYIAPSMGQAVIRNGHFAFIFGAADGKTPLASEAGTYAVSGDVLTFNVKYATNPKSIGQSYSTKQFSWAGDTATYAFLNDKGEQTGTGRAVRISR
jgi:predicted ester cyclase